MKIYLIRHCESEDDIINCYGGCADFDLTEFGIETAKNVAKGLMGLDIQKVFTSPYKRAKSTAKIISDKLKCELEIVNDIREHNVHGVMSGVNKELAKEIFSYWLDQDKYKDYHKRGQCFYGGEEEVDLIARVKTAFKYLTGQNLNTIVVVSHGGVIRRIWKHLLNKSEKITDIDDGAIIEIDFVDGKYILLKTKGVKHD